MEVLTSKTPIWRIAVIASFFALLQSCATMSLEGSIDGYRETFSGGPYDYSSPSAEDIGMNVGLIFMGVPETGSPDDGFYGHNKNQPVYAGTNLNPASLAFLNQTPVIKNYDFTDHLTYMSGLEFIMKRAGDGGASTNLDYLQIPIYGIYQTRFKSGTAFGGLGPYFAYGIAGKNGGDGASVSSFGGAEGFNRFDAGLDVTLGYRLTNSLYVRAVYSHGLANIEPASGGFKVRNSGFSLNVGYPLSKLIKAIRK